MATYHIEDKRAGTIEATESELLENYTPIGADWSGAIDLEDGVEYRYAIRNTDGVRVKLYRDERED